MIDIDLLCVCVCVWLVQAATDERDHCQDDVDAAVVGVALVRHRTAPESPIADVVLRHVADNTVAGSEAVASGVFVRLTCEFSLLAS